MRLTGVYAITCKANGKKYIGSVQTSFNTRSSTHRSRLRSGKSRGKNHHCIHLQNAWNLYGEDAFEFSIVEICDPSQCVPREQRIIDELWDSGILFNSKRDAGKGGSPTAETRARISEAGRRRAPPSPETRALLSSIAKNRPPVSPETRSRMSASRKKRAPATPETRSRMSASRKGKPTKSPDLETRALLSKMNTGKRLSDSTKALMSAAKKGVPKSEQAKINMSISAKNRKSKVPKLAGDILLSNKISK